MDAVSMVFRAEWRRRWRSWLALAALVAVVGGLSIGAVAAGNRTARAFPGFVKAHGFDGFFFTNAPLPQLAHLPEVASVTTVVTPFNGQPSCACSGSINSSTFNLFGMSSSALARTVNLVAGRMPNPSDPHEVLASFDLMQNYGVHIGTVFHVPLFAASQASAVENSTGAGPSPTGPTVSLRVVGIEAAELEFPSGTTQFFDLYTTPAFERSVVPLEAQASGRPVIAYGVGGALASVIDGSTGVFFHEQTVDSLASVLAAFDEQSFDTQVIRNHALEFDMPRFRRRIVQFIEAKMSEGKVNKLPSHQTI